MKKIMYLILLLYLATACSTTKKTSSSNLIKNDSELNTHRDGSSYEKAIIINEKTETAGVPAEYSWLREHYPGYTMKRQSLSYHNKKAYDILEIVTEEGEEISIYFDISKFFGK